MRTPTLPTPAKLAWTSLGLLILLLPGLHAADLITGSLQCAGSTIELATDFNSPLYAIGGFMIALIALAYMAGQGLEKPEWTVWARTEAVTLVWSIALIAAILGAFASSCTVSNTLLGGHGLEGAAPANTALTPGMRASLYLDHLLRDYGVGVASELVRSSLNDQMRSLGYAYWSIPVWDGGGLAYQANQRAWASHKDLIADIYLPFMSSIMAQKLLIDIAIPGVFGIILPAALMLRMLFVTRDVGNLLIALSFALYFALPLTYVFFFDATAAVQKEVLDAKEPGRPFGALTLGYDGIVGDSMQRVGFMATQAIIAPNLAIVVTVSLTMALYKAFRGMVA